MRKENSMNASIEAKKAEAVERMKLWGIYPPIIKCFEQEGIVSESAPPLGTCSRLEGEQLERVRKFEKKYNAVVYHVIHSFTNIGELESYLFVSDRPDEWETDRKELKSGQPLAWVYNYDEPDWPELGYIGVSLTTAAGLRRTW
jgi:hypothetical protein